MNRLISVILLIVLAMASLMGCNTANHQPRRDSSQKIVQLTEGEYLSTEYIEELRRTRSPLKAGGRRGGLELVRVRREGKQSVIQPVINFHEGDSEFAINSDGSIARAPERSITDLSNVSATVLDDHTIRLGYGDFKSATYVCVKDAATYVSKAVLAGRYKDEQGRGYSFQEDGWAVFPERKFEFEIGLDHVLNDYDYFMDAGPDKKHLPWRVWAFKWNRNALQIFKTREEDEEGGFEKIVGRKPLFVLHPVR